MICKARRDLQQAEGVRTGLNRRTPAGVTEGRSVEENPHTTGDHECQKQSVLCKSKGDIRGRRDWIFLLTRQVKTEAEMSDAATRQEKPRLAGSRRSWKR